MSAQQRLLLHSLAEFESLILPVLETVGPRRVVELGGEGGGLTEVLARWAADRPGVEIHCIEPEPSPPLLALEAAGSLRLTRGLSPAALTGLPGFDLYVVDGDHNFHTVQGELAAVFGDREAPARLAILHDVGWPWARRDLYYDPEVLPAEARHPYTFEGGVRPEQPGVAEVGGFRSEGSFAFAVQEGGERNGVLTAVEDLLDRRDDLELLRVPCIFGLGFLFPRAAEWADRLKEQLRPFHESDLLARLERNRVDLYLEVLTLQDEVERLSRRQSALVGSLHAEVGQLAAENAKLRLERAHAGQAPADA